MTISAVQFVLILSVIGNVFCIIAVFWADVAKTGSRKLVPRSQSHQRIKSRRPVAFLLLVVFAGLLSGACKPTAVPTLLTACVAGNQQACAELFHSGRRGE
jgi:hypothetical protein